MEQPSVTQLSLVGHPERATVGCFGSETDHGRPHDAGAVYLKKGGSYHSIARERADQYILEGGLRFWIGADESEVIDVLAGEVLHIPSHVPHKPKRSKTRSTWTVFSPPRQDWLGIRRRLFKTEVGRNRKSRARSAQRGRNESTGALTSLESWAFRNFSSALDKSESSWR